MFQNFFKKFWAHSFFGQILTKNGSEFEFSFFSFVKTCWNFLRLTALHACVLWRGSQRRIESAGYKQKEYAPHGNDHQVRWCFTTSNFQNQTTNNPESVWVWFWLVNSPVSVQLATTFLGTSIFWPNFDPKWLSVWIFLLVFFSIHQNLLKITRLNVRVV